VIPNQSDQRYAHWNEVMRLSWQEMHNIARPHSLHLQKSDKAVSSRPPCSALPLTGSCPYVQTMQVSTSECPCSQTLIMQMMRSCSLRMTFSGHPSLNHSIQSRTLRASTHPGKSHKFKILPPDLHHFSVSYHRVQLPDCT